MTTKRSSGVFWVDGVQRLGEQLAIAFEWAKERIKQAKTGFIWIRPDGKAVNCSTAAGLVKALMSYDGKYLRDIERAAARYPR